MGKGFSEHGLILYLNPKLYLGLVNLQADHGLGKSYAGLLAFVEGMYQLGYLDAVEYDVLHAKYSRGLMEQEQPALTLEQTKEQKQLDAKDRQFNGQLEQWDLHPNPEWRRKVWADAENYVDKLESAKQLLALKAENSEGS